MTKEAEHESLAAPTPASNRFLENLQHDAGEFVRLQEELMPKELRLWVKSKVADRAKEFAGLGFFSLIPQADIGHLEDDRPGQLGLVVHTESDSQDGYVRTAVVLVPGGTLRESYASESMDESGINFDFEYSKEVPHKDCPKYFDEAVEAMRYQTDRKTGVHAAEFRREQTERRETHIQKIADDNQKYGVEGAAFTDEYPQTIEKANEFMQRIARLRGMVAGEHRGITREQLENLLGHIFAAEEYSNADNHLVSTKSTNLNYLNGAEELIFMAGILVSPRDAWIGEELYLLMTDAWNGAPSQSGYLVRRANRVPYRDNPENGRIYEAMVMYKIGRHYEGEVLLDVPEFRQPRSEVSTKNYGVVSSAEITDWLLNQPVAEPL